MKLPELSQTEERFKAMILNGHTKPEIQSELELTNWEFISMTDKVLPTLERTKTDFYIRKMRVTQMECEALELAKKIATGYSTPTILSQYRILINDLEGARVHETR